MKFTFPVYITVDVRNEQDGKRLIHETLEHRRVYSGECGPMNISWNIGSPIILDDKNPSKNLSGGRPDEHK